MIVVSDDYVLLHVCTYCIGRRREGLMKFIKFLQDVISGIYIDSQDDHIDSQDDHIDSQDDHIDSQDDHIDCDRDSRDDHNDACRYSEDVVDYIDVDYIDVHYIDVDCNNDSHSLSSFLDI